MLSYNFNPFKMEKIGHYNQTLRLPAERATLQGARWVWGGRPWAHIPASPSLPGCISLAEVFHHSCNFPWNENNHIHDGN